MLTNRPKSIFDKWETANAGVFSRMFGKVDAGGDFTKGGLGIDEPSFMTKYWPTSDNDQSSGRYSTTELVNTSDHDLYPINVCDWLHTASSTGSSPAHG